jgi:hypothetical protein
MLQYQRVKYTMELITLAYENQGKSIRDQLDSCLNQLPEGERLQRVLAVLDTAGELDECVTELVWESWDYLKAHRLWQYQYLTLEALQDAIGYETSLKTLLERHEILTARKQREARGIYKNWGKHPHESLPAHICPPRFSDSFLRALHQLSRECSLNQAMTLLGDKISQRQLRSRNAWTRASEPYALRGDILEVLNQQRLLKSQMVEDE